MSWLKEYWLISLIHIMLVGCVITYGYNKYIYSGIEEWPSSPAEIISHSQVSGHARTDRQYYGTGSSTWSSEFVVYRYIIDGVAYEGRRISPNGGDYHQRPRYEVIESSQRVDGEVPLRRLPLEHRAYYHPSNHALAVLDPKPYSGVIPIFLGILTGVMVTIQHFLRVRA